MIEIVPVVTLGELITPIAICTVGFTQCLLIYTGMRRMDRASEERRQQIEQHRRQLDQQQEVLNQNSRKLDQQQETLNRQFELQRQALDQQREALNQQLDRQQQALDQQGEILRDVGRGIQELIRQGQQTR